MLAPLLLAALTGCLPAAAEAVPAGSWTTPWVGDTVRWQALLGGEPYRDLFTPSLHAGVVLELAVAAVDDDALWLHLRVEDLEGRPLEHPLVPASLWLRTARQDPGPPARPEGLQGVPVTVEQAGRTWTGVSWTTDQRVSDGPRQSWVSTDPADGTYLTGHRIAWELTSSGYGGPVQVRELSLLETRRGRPDMANGEPGEARAWHRGTWARFTPDATDLELRYDARGDRLVVSAVRPQGAVVVEERTLFNWLHEVAWRATSPWPTQGPEAEPAGELDLPGGALPVVGQTFHWGQQRRHAADPWHPSLAGLPWPVRVRALETITDRPHGPARVERLVAWGTD